MTLDEIIRIIENPFGRNLNGISMLVCCAPDNGQLAIKLARHSARVVLITGNREEYDNATERQPQALNMEIIHTNIEKWIATNRHFHFDMTISFDTQLETLPNEPGGRHIELNYGNNSYTLTQR